MNNTIMNDEIMQGKPLEIERQLQLEMANQILKMSGNDYENVCDNMRIYADVFELLEEHINDDFITLKYNTMGNWYVEDEEKRHCSICGKEMNSGYYNEDEFKYYCSDECLHKDYTEEEYNKLYDNGNGNFYWTEWECE